MQGLYGRCTSHLTASILIAVIHGFTQVSSFIRLASAERRDNGANSTNVTHVFRIHTGFPAGMRNAG